MAGSIRLFCLCLTISFVAQSVYASPLQSGSGNGSVGQQDTNGNSGSQDGSSNQAGGSSSSNKGKSSTQNGGNGSSQGSQSDITVGDKTGKIESYLLATAAVHKAALEIADKISTSAPATTRLVIYNQQEHTTLQELAQFRVQYYLLDSIYTNALKPLPANVNEMPSETQEFNAASIPGAETAVTGIAAIAQSVVQTLALFKSKITTNGVDVSLDNEVLVDEVAAALLRKKIKAFRPSLYYPAIFDEKRIAQSKILSNLQSLFTDKADALNEIATLDAQISSLQDAISTAKAKDDKATADKLAPYLQARVQKETQLKAANVAFDSLLEGLLGASNPAPAPKGPGSSGVGTTENSPSNGDNKDQSKDASTTNAPACNSAGNNSTGDFASASVSNSTTNDNSGTSSSAGNGTDKKNATNGGTQSGAKSGNGTGSGSATPRLADLIFADLLQANITDEKLPILTLQIQQSGGGYLTKSNIFTFFGGPTLYHMGGSVVSFTLLSTDSGDVIGAGAVPVYGGFVKSSQIERTIDKQMSPQKSKGHETSNP